MKEELYEYWSEDISRLDDKVGKDAYSNPEPTILDNTGLWKDEDWVKAYKEYKLKDK